MEFLAVVEHSSLATTLRHSLWVYPIVNVAHILGITLLVGSIVPMDLRLLGAWQNIPVATLATVLLPFAVAGLAIAVLTGAALFAVQPRDYAALPLFWIKLGFILVGAVNALALRLTRAWPEQLSRSSSRVTSRIKVAALISLVVWMTALVSGRMLGYL